MAALPLKEYQTESLEAIGRFCDQVRQFAASGAMRPIHDAFHADTGRDYISVPQVPQVPYFCLRVPTGGGKTLIAAHAVGKIAQRLGRQDYPLGLWVTPSTTIRDQTLNGLKNREHPYHAALREGLGGPFDVLTVEEALGSSRAMQSGNAVIVVTTIQSYRIDEEANRRMYQDDGYLMELFQDLPDWMRSRLEAGPSGRVRLSLANAMKLRGPVVIMDEAHNARTRVSFESLARFGPLAVLELTATPQQEHDVARELYASNVLHAVSALQLRREGMIKLPIELESREEWLDVLAATIECRKQLDVLAKQVEGRFGRYIRPIALIQAQPRSATREHHTAERVHEALTQRFGIPEERIRIATGHADTLQGQDLCVRECPVEYVVTVDKLREGWDCPFAYVLGSIGNVATETAVEQLLGRVMRMPQATPTGIPELDRAYAIVQSPDVLRTASGLRDSLIHRCGFDKTSAEDAFRVIRQVEGQRSFPLATIPLSEAPNAAQLPPAVRRKVEYDEADGLLRVNQPLTREDAIAVRDSLGNMIDRESIEHYWQREREIGTAAKRLEEYAKPFLIPQLAIRDGERVFLFEPEELDEFDWNLDGCDHQLLEEEFDVALRAGERVTVSVTNEGATRVGSVQDIILHQLNLVEHDSDWSDVQLIRWLNTELHRDDRFAGVTGTASGAWLRRAVDYLVRDRAADLKILVRKRHALADAVIPRLAEHGRKQVREAANMLIAGRGTRRLETSFEHVFEVPEHEYGPYRRFEDPANELTKHAFTLIGDMNGEEAECARRINDHPNVKRWIRNLEQESAAGFSLPLSPGRFFPDFICELEDGRVALVEYKGRQRDPLPQEQHKKAVGELWASLSNARAAFAWIVDRDWGRLDNALSLA